jgi:hypothetical protein
MSNDISTQQDLDRACKGAARDFAKLGHHEPNVRTSSRPALSGTLDGVLIVRSADDRT